MRFDSYHPTINLIFFTLVIGATICFNHPVFVAISFICSFIYAIKLNGIKALVFNICLIIVMSAFVYYYAGFNHFGETNISTTWVDNNITLESIVYAIILALTIASVVMWFSCIHAVFYADKIIYLFGRVFPKLSLYLSIILRTVPRIKERWKKVSVAQQCIGKGPNQGNLLARFVNIIRVTSILATWTLDDFMQTTESMKSRGYSLKKRTSFSIYRFDNRDRSFVVTIFACGVVLMVGILLNQTTALYDPRIVINKLTFGSYVFYGVYAGLCLLPMGLQIIGERKFNKLYKTAGN